MSDVRAGQFEVVLSDGLRIQRLPVGLAASLWWVTFVFTGVDFSRRSPARYSNFFFEVRDIIRLDGPAGQITLGPTSSNGGEAICTAHYEFAESLPWLKVSYVEAGRTVASETLDLR